MNTIGRSSQRADHLTVSIVIPVFNGEATIEQLCDQLIAQLSDSWRLQIVLVDDGSRDRSVSICRELCERYPDVIDFIMLSRNFGEHNAVMAGLNYAEGDYCVIMDDDLQNPPSEVHKLIEEIAKGYDVVYTRYVEKKHATFRNLFSRFHNWLATRALGKPADLYLSSFKVLSHFVVREVVRYTGPDPYLDGIILRATRNIGVVTTEHKPRKEGRSGYTLGKLFSLWGNMVVAFSIYPLRLMGLFGITMLIIGATEGIYVLVALALESIPDPDATQQIIASMWFFRGITMLAISIVGEYVGRSYLLLTRDPQFVIRNAIIRQLQAPGRASGPVAAGRPRTS